MLHCYVGGDLPFILDRTRIFSGGFTCSCVLRMSAPGHGGFSIEFEILTGIDITP